MLTAESESGMGPEYILESAKWALNNHERDPDLRECISYTYLLLRTGQLSPEIMTLIRATQKAELIAMIPNTPTIH